MTVVLAVERLNRLETSKWTTIIPDCEIFDSSAPFAMDGLLGVWYFSSLLSLPLG